MIMICKEVDRLTAKVNQMYQYKIMPVSYMLYTFSMCTLAAQMGKKPINYEATRDLREHI